MPSKEKKKRTRHLAIPSQAERKKLECIISPQSLQVLGLELSEEVVQLGDQLAVDVDDLQMSCQNCWCVK